MGQIESEYDARGKTRPLTVAREARQAKQASRPQKKTKTREKKRNESAGALGRPLARVGGRFRGGGAGQRTRVVPTRPNARRGGERREKK
jgi:hypothetical protein